MTLLFDSGRVACRRNDSPKVLPQKPGGKAKRYNEIVSSAPQPMNTRQPPVKRSAPVRPVSTNVSAPIQKRRRQNDNAHLPNFDAVYWMRKKHQPKNKKPKNKPKNKRKNKPQPAKSESTSNFELMLVGHWRCDSIFWSERRRGIGKRCYNRENCKTPNRIVNIDQLEASNG